MRLFVEIQKRIVHFIVRSNWILLVIAGLLCLINLPSNFAYGFIAGGIIVTVNFHLLSRTLKKALTPPAIASVNSVIARYFIRFAISGFIIFLLIAMQVVNPLGLLAGLSIVVLSIFMATACELTKFIFFREAM